MTLEQLKRAAAIAALNEIICRLHDLLDDPHDLLLDCEMAQALEDKDDGISAISYTVMARTAYSTLDIVFDALQKTRDEIEGDT